MGGGGGGGAGVNIGRSLFPGVVIFVEIDVSFIPKTRAIQLIKEI